MATGVGGMWLRFMGEFDISQKLGIGMAEIRIMSASSEELKFAVILTQIGDIPDIFLC